MRLSLVGAGAASLLLALLASGCSRQTIGVTAATARPGEMGFGAAVHEQSVFTGPAVAAVGHAAIVDREPPAGSAGDAVWQVHARGRALRHCTILQGGQRACVEAQLPDRVKGVLLIVDPLTLGKYVTVTRLSEAGGAYVHASRPSVGPRARGRSRLPATKSHGIWVRQSNILTPPWHCQIEDGGPRCRSIPPDVTTIFGQSFLHEDVLARITIDEVDILWLSRFGAVARCTASRAEPVPRCRTAEMR